uniref:RNA-directed RNA polymerase n=1 Tax=Vinca chlorotic spot virus TaxID=3076770 RepID=A0AA96HFK5_9RHAB|nr:RNA-dependent RNA polymerase [Vinca chlorotic spot virus]
MGQLLLQSIYHYSESNLSSKHQSTKYIMEALLSNSYTENTLSHIQEEGSIQEKNPVDGGGDYHLKSALRHHSDYLKTHYQSRQLRQLGVLRDTKVANNPCKLLPIIWSSAMSGQSFVDESAAYHLGDTYKDQSSIEEMVHLVTNELNIIMSGDYTSALMAEARSIMREMWDQKCSLGRVNLIRLGLTHMVINMNRGDKAIEDPICLVHEGGNTSYYLSSVLHFSNSQSWSSVHVLDTDGTVNMNHIVNLLDKMTERVNIMIYNRLCRATPMYELYPSLDSLMLTIAAGDSLIMDVGNDAYRGLACFEALCVGSIISRGDSSVWDVNRFLATMKSEVKELGLSYSRWLDELMWVLDSQNTQQISCLHGIYRIWGHPVVDLEKGLEKLRSVALLEKDISPEYSRNTSNMFKETFFCNYYKKHKFYPPYSWIGPEGNCYILQALSLEREIDRQNVRYHLEDWCNVQCEKTFEVPATYSLATCIKDRAVSPKKSELIKMVQERGSVMDQTSRRGVLRWLHSAMMPVRDFLDKINEDGLDNDDCIIGLYPKERELKNEARYFALMSFNMRLYFTITEHLANDHLLEYFPMVTMSDSMLELQKKLDMLSKKQTSNKEGTIYYVVNIDFRKWNQQMREEMTRDLFWDTDRLFGYTNLVGRTHQIFKKSYIYLSSGEYVPKISSRGNLTFETPYSWTNDPSGKEGLRQKYWTIMTACDIMFVSRRYGMKIDLVGGGDNQVMIVEVNTDLTNNDGTMSDAGKADCKSKMLSFMDSLSQYMEAKGLPLKVEETWISPDLLMFFKMMYFNSVTLVSPLKQASRVFPLSNDQVMTIGNMASTVSSAITVLSSKDMQLGPAILLGRITIMELSNMVCKNHPLSKDGSMWSSHVSKCLGGYRNKVAVLTKNKTPRNMFLSLALHHKVLGGSAIISPLGMMMRGFPDPLCEHLTWIHLISQVEPGYRCYGSMSINTTQPWSHLLEDPVSVNHDAPVHGLAVLRREAEKALATATGYANKDFMILAHTCNKEMMEELATSLCAGENLDIRILHDIMGANLGGYFNSIASKVNKTSTVMRMNRTSTVIETIAGQEKVCMSYLVSYSSFVHDMSPSSCPTETARKYRRVSWGKNIMGITTPHPAAFLEYHSGPHQCDHNYVQVKTSSSSLIDPFKRGAFPIYQGSYTKEKFKPTEMAAAYGEEDLLSRAIHLMKLINWRYPQDSNMARVLRGLLASLTDAEPSLFYGMMEWISGDAEHRYQDTATKHGGVPNIAYSILSYVRANTSTFRKHSRGGKNETLHFQAVIIFVSMISLFKKYGGIGHWHECCSKCIQTTTIDPVMKITRRIPFRTIKGNMYAYVPAESVKFHYHDIRKIEMFNSLSDRTITMSDMTPDERARAAASLLSAVIVSCDSKDRTSDTVSSITLWSDYMGPEMIVSMVCFRAAVDHLIRRHEWTWPRPTLSKRTILLLEPFLVSPEGRKFLNCQHLDTSEMSHGRVQLLRDIIYNIINPNLLPHIIPNRVSPIWVNDVISAKVSENNHITGCDDCINLGGKVSKFDICGDTALVYHFRICSITLPVLKGDMSQIERLPSPMMSHNWESTPVQMFEILENGYPFILFPKDGPITMSVPIGIHGIGALIDIIAETKGRVTVSTSTVSMAIWRHFLNTREVSIYNQGRSCLESTCDMHGMDVETADLYLDSESVDQLTEVIYDADVECQAGWWLVTSRSDINGLYNKCKSLRPVMVLSSGSRPLCRAICAVKLVSGAPDTWGGLQSIYRSLEGRCLPYVSKLRNPTAKTKTISHAVSLYYACDGSYEAAMDQIIIKIRSMFWQKQLYTKVGRETVYLAVVMELSRLEDGINQALKLGRIRALSNPRRVRGQMNSEGNRRAASDVRDVRMLYRGGVPRGSLTDGFGLVIVV